MYELIGAADFTPGRGVGEDILAIIAEEIEPCLTGRKTYKEAADIIQNRVQNMISE